MKIAISGAANTGKTTLAEDLANEMKLPLIEERFAELPRRTPQDRSGDLLANAFLRIHREKLDLEQSYSDGFISDRCTIDLFNYWACLPVLAKKPETLEVYKQCRDHVNNYDYVVFLNWGSLAFREVVEDKPKFADSNMNPWLNLTRHSSTLGLAYTWLDHKKIIVVDKNIIDRKQRVDWLLETISNRAK